MFTVFNLAVFISAFLLFLIQPMVANILLPRAGGSPNIWNACSVFFQTSLLAGYLYSYLVSKKLSLKRQIMTHCLLLFCALWMIDFHFRSSLISVESPVLDILLLLLKNLFFPFVLLSTTSPLLQNWLSLTNLKENKNPYILYVCSNIGSLSALYAYPLMFEKKLAISAQGDLWHLLFAVFFGMVFVLCFYLNRHIQARSEKTEAATQTEKTNPVLIFYWIFFAFVPSSLMLGVTSHLSINIGGLPFLWIFPLSLYLLSFILTFSRFYTEKASSLFQMLYASAAFVIVSFFFIHLRANIKDNILLTVIHCFLYFVCAVYCHGQLAFRKPNPKKLTLFYLCLAAGGALGGIFNTFIAPHLFLFVWEYPFIVVSSLPFVMNSFPAKRTAFFKIAIQTLVLIVCLFSLQSFFKHSDVVFQKRNFFGTILIKQKRLSAPSSFLLGLIHGDTVHGRQKLSTENGENVYDFNPDTYYGPKAAVKDFFSVFERPYVPEAAWLGLGGGAIICYAPSEAKHDVFEIDRDIVDISTKYHYFRYLEHCAPQADIKVGDARIEIAKKENRKYDLIAIDVFSSHYIPVHLTTKEAIETYRSKLKPDGVILFHISARTFDVEPILTKIAEASGMAFIVRHLPEADSEYPQWGVLSNSYDDPEIKALLTMPGWRKGEMEEKTPLWTDDFHNLLSALRR